MTVGPVSLGVRAFQGRWGSSGRLDGSVWCQGKAARSRCQAWEMAGAQRQVASMRSRVWRAGRVMGAGACRTREREVSDLQRAGFGGAGEPRSFGQATGEVAA